MESYSSYKDSGVEWIGDIPIEWGKTKIKFHFDLIGGFPFDSKLITNEVNEYPIIRIGNVTSGKVDVYYEGELIDKIPIVGNGDYVVSLTGDFSIREWNNKKSLLNQRCGLFKNKNDNSTRYLFYLLPFHFRVLEKTKYFTTLKNLSNDEVLNLLLLNPPKETQSQIVSFLDNKTQKIDDLIQKTEKKIELLEEKRTSLINHCVTKGLNPNVEMKDSGVEWIGDIPSHWIKTSIKMLIGSGDLQIQDGNHGEIHPTSKDYKDEGIPFVMSSNLKNGKVEYDSCKKLSKELTDKLRIGFSYEGDILLSHKGSIGKVSIVKDIPYPYIMLTPQVTYYRCMNNRIINKFLFYVFQSNYFQLDMDLLSSDGSTRKFIGIVDQRNLKFILSSLEEQTQIVEYLDEKTQKIDSTIEKETQRIELLKEYRQSLISEVVTGKVDVRDYNG
jgi:type I restriction enzyme, S subunit